MIKEIPGWNQYTLSVQEASKYFRISEKKLRNLIDEHKDEPFILWNGNRPQIKRQHVRKCTKMLI